MSDSSKLSGPAIAICGSLLALGAMAVACGGAGGRASEGLPRILADTSPPPGRTRPRIVLSIDEPIEWTFHFVNSGSAPAFHVAGRSAVIPAASASTEVDAFFQDLPERLPLSGAQAKSMPDERSEAITARSRAAASPDDFNGLSHDGALYLAGRFEYESAGGIACRTDFCRFTLERGGTRDCPAHNEVRCGR